MPQYFFEAISILISIARKLLSLWISFFFGIFWWCLAVVSSQRWLCQPTRGERWHCVLKWVICGHLQGHKMQQRRECLKSFLAVFVWLILLFNCKNGYWKFQPRTLQPKSSTQEFLTTAWEDYCLNSLWSWSEATVNVLRQYVLSSDL